MKHIPVRYVENSMIFIIQAMLLRKKSQSDSLLASGQEIKRLIGIGFHNFAKGLAVFIMQHRALAHDYRGHGKAGRRHQARPWRPQAVELQTGA